jgi:carboxyl-terminal processing protease
VRQISNRIKNSTKTKSSQVSVAKVLAIIIGVVGIFSLGWAVGNGRINIGKDAIFKSSVNSKLPADLDYRSVEQVYDKLRQSFDGELDEAKLIDGLKEGLAKASGDPYTEYYNKEGAKEFDDELNGTFTGIGAELTKNEDAIVVVAPIAGYPADKAGLRAKDVILEIDGESTYGMTVGEAVKKVRGPKDSKVKLTILRDGKEKLDFEIIRDQINIPSVKYEIKDDIGFITISRYSEDTAGLVKQAATEFKQANVKGVVLDLRGNPGGLLDSAVDVSGVWLPNGSVVLQEKRNGVIIRTYKSEGSPILNGVPTVVLIDEGSASASEITAGALKDNGVATLIGVKSFGKGSVQALERLIDGSVLKVTIAKWYTPNDVNINKEGIQPDQKVEFTEDDYKNNKDPQKDAAINFLLNR